MTPGATWRRRQRPCEIFDAKRGSGFTLLETVVALALLALTLLLGLALVVQPARIERRLAAQRAALHQLEATLEALRAGVLPLASQQLGPSGEQRLVITVEVEAVSYPAGLYQVQVAARYPFEGQLRERRVETLVWRPDP